MTRIRAVHELPGPPSPGVLGWHFRLPLNEIPTEELRSGTIAYAWVRWDEHVYAAWTAKRSGAILHSTRHHFPVVLTPARERRRPQELPVEGYARMQVRVLIPAMYRKHSPPFRGWITCYTWRPDNSNPLIWPWWISRWRREEQQRDA